LHDRVVGIDGDKLGGRRSFVHVESRFDVAAALRDLDPAVEVRDLEMPRCHTVLARAEILPPLVAAWSANALFATLGLYLYLRART
jgi:hypothetical protein